MRISLLTVDTHNRMLEKSFLYRALQVLSRQDRFKVALVVVIQSFSGLLDLAGVAIFGVLGALAISGLESGQPGNRVNAVLKLIGLQNFSLQYQALILGMAATTLLIARTVFSVYFTRRTLHFLSRRGAKISAHLVSKLLTQPLTRIQEKSVQDTVYALAHGVNVVTIGIVGITVTMVSDFSLLLVMGIGLFIIDPGIAVSTAIVFFVIGYSLHRLMHYRATLLGEANARLSIKSDEKIIEVLSSYREAFVRNRRSYYVSKIENLRLELADTVAEMQFMPNVSKYVIETTVLLGAMSIAGVQFWLNDATHAVATLSIFLAAGTRIAPAALRIQQGLIQLRTNMGVADPTLRLIEEFEYLVNSETQKPLAAKIPDNFAGFIEIKNLDFTYPNNLERTIKSVSIEIAQGEFVAFVGGSGAGKTTLVDLILGVLNPDSGKVLISGVDPETAFGSWPGTIGYVPQDTFISNGSIRENVALGFDPSSFADSEIWNALRIAQLEDMVQNFPDSLDTYIGDRGTRLSGGQRQRIGIARALLTNPKILFLDEATSSLDAETEDALSKAINGLKGEVTLIVIAHRLSTIKNADNIFYLKNGEVVKSGKFEELKLSVPSFATQAQLMGL